MPLILINLIKNYGGYALLIAAGSGWFLWHDHQEIAKGEARYAAQQKAADKKEADHVSKVEADAKLKTDGLQTRLDTALSAPAPQPRVVVRMCNAPPAANQTDPNRPAGGEGNGAAGSGSTVGGGDQEATDIAPFTEQILKDDRAIIEYLQGYVLTCQAAGVCGK